MLIRRAPDVLPSDITPESAYLDRRAFLRQSAHTIGGTAAATTVLTGLAALPAQATVVSGNRFDTLQKSSYSTQETMNTEAQITSYNNFYEYGTDKEDPARKAFAGMLKTHPWTLKVSGECAAPATVDLDTLIKNSVVEERIYRMRCVEGWSMVIPWAGIPLGQVLTRFKPNGNAKFVEFISLADPKQMPAVSQMLSLLPWPYREGLRIDEAMHPLALLAVGLYGKQMPQQNGAPIRLITPWKYGFKGIKSIVEIRFVREQPKSTWNIYAPQEYGFYSNVNPNVPHPRWSQANERRIGSLRRIPTQMFNGYAEQVASLYRGMDLTQNF